MQRPIIPIILIFFLFLATPAMAMENPQVIMETSKGTVVIELFGHKAPMTTANFVAYVQAKFYDNTIFHRVMSNFMIQGGGFTADMNKKKTRPPIRNEADNGLKNNTGTIAMARTPDPHSATAQFFINVKDNVFLNHKSKTQNGWGYCVFGRVIKGMEVVRAIETVMTTTKEVNRAVYQNVPVDPVIIKSVTMATMLEAPHHEQQKPITISTDAD